MGPLDARELAEENKPPSSGNKKYKREGNNSYIYVLREHDIIRKPLHNAFRAVLLHPGVHLDVFAMTPVAYRSFEVPHFQVVYTVRNYKQDTKSRINGRFCSAYLS